MDGNSLPPPSTIAAQIVHNRSNAARQEPGNKALFGKLLQEYLRDPVFEDSSVETHAQLIQVVAEAGLDVLSADDPFAPNALLDQANDSLLVIKLTISRKPDVLLYCGAEDSDTPPFMLWILAKVLGLIGRPNLASIQVSLSILILEIVLVLSNRSRTLTAMHAFLGMLEQLVEDILFALENQREGREPDSIHFRVAVPSATNMNALWPNATSLLLLPPGYQTEILDIVQAQLIVTELLFVLGHPLLCVSRTSNVSKFAETWLVECYHRLQEYCVSATGIRSEDADRVLSSLAKLLQRHLSSRCSRRRIVSFLDIITNLLEYLTFQQHPCAITALMETIAIWLQTYAKDETPRIHICSLLAPMVHDMVQRLPSDLGSELTMAMNQVLALLADANASSSQEQTRPAKRQRIQAPTPNASALLREQIIKDITQRLTGSSASNMPELGAEAVIGLANLEDPDREPILELIGSLPCVVSRSMKIGSNKNGVGICKICDIQSSTHQALATEINYDQATFETCVQLLSFMSLCIEQNHLKRSKAFRIALANAIRRIVNHTNDSKCSLLEWKGIGPWLMHSLQSSVRELRVASAKALAAYLREDLPTAVKERNRPDTIGFLRLLAEKNILYVQETTAFAWGLIGKLCGERELNLALIELVDYLGHSHPIISAAAYREILQLAEFHSCSPLELVRPYWRSLASHVVKDMYICPQKIQQLADALGMSVSDFLIHTQADTVPFLILTRKRDVLQRIAQARGPSIGVHDLWLQPSKNLASVLGLLLVQPAEDAEQATIALLRDASPTFTENDLSSLVKVDPIQISCEILKQAADLPEVKRVHAHDGLRLLAAINERKPASGKANRSSKTLISFLEGNILGIMSHFGDILDAPNERQPLPEKARALRAVEQLVIVGESRIAIAVPQIRATLQSASKNPALLDVAFRTWSTLVGVASEDEIEFLIDQTFAMIAHYWNDFGTETQSLAFCMMEELIKKHNAKVRDRVPFIPSLAGIEVMQKFESEVSRFKNLNEPMTLFQAFILRCADENAVIVNRALIDLVQFLDANQHVLHESALSQQPSPYVGSLSRVLYDAVIRFKEHEPAIAELAVKCIGAIGSIDPNKIDDVREKHDILMLSNFEKADEAINFVVDMLERVLVDAFHSAPTGRVQTYLAYAMQELLRFCGFRQVLYKARSSQSDTLYQRWLRIPAHIRSTLTPFFNTRYALVHPSEPAGIDSFPIYKPGMTHGTWLRTFVFNLLHQATTENTRMVFPVLSRIIWGHDIAVPTFLLPYVVLNIVVDGNDQHTAAISAEFLNVLSADLGLFDDRSADEVKQCSENIFQVLDYLSRWLQAKKKQLNESGSGHSRSVAQSEDYDIVKETEHLSSVEAVLFAVPADIVSQRATQCRSFARAILNREQHIRKLIDIAKRKNESLEMDAEFRQLQDIYAQIEEPDAVEGMSTRLQILDPEQQVLEHKRAGRWAAAQSWYEICLDRNPSSCDIQVELLHCLRQSNRFGQLVDTAQSLAIEYPASSELVLPFATEAAWATGKWDALQRFLNIKPGTGSFDFNTELGRLYSALVKSDTAQSEQIISKLRGNIISAITSSSTKSLATAHPLTVRLHALYEVEQITAVSSVHSYSADEMVERMNKRLNILGACTVDKQYLLGIRRAAMQLSSLGFSKQQLGANWLASARLSRNAGLSEAAYDAVLHATDLHDGAAMIEHSRLLWQDGQHRKAIQNLRSAIDSNVFQSYTTSMLEGQTNTGDIEGSTKNQNFLAAKTQLLLAKWMDRAGHSKSEELRNHYLQACRSFTRWEKGHYYMGKHYLKIFDSEKALPRAKQSDVYITGDLQKLITENFMRSMVFGAKYLYETVPKMLTLWLDLAAEIHRAEQNPRGIDQQSHSARVKKLETIHKQVKKYMIDRLPSYIFYTALPQVTSRINHAHARANEILLQLITKIVNSHPQQSLWTILAVSKSRAKDKATKASFVLNQLKRAKSESTVIDMLQLINHGEKLTTALLAACEVNVESRSSRASLQRDLGFQHKLAPCQLVVPVEKALSANLPTGMGGATIRAHKAFSRAPIIISSFQDDVLVLSSLQRPKKLTMRGSDGILYGLLCKPKDDLRKDQRLMEFTTMIDRGLKRDVESSKRRLYIHTYAVTPLNEECGAIEWVDGLKPMRDIILANFKAKGVRPDYGEIRQLLDRACADPDGGSWKVFSDVVVPKFPAVLHEWFIDTFPEPDAWFTARLRYTRSCAVMSMVGNALGLGDRHGENILLEEGNGGCFHVDFNCLFDKGLTFEKPELVPFRLTHNVVDAFGVYGYEGPFRVAAELTLKTLKQYEDTLMTIMETFIYDPTTDFISKPKRRVANVPETPAEVLESVKAKINGLLPGETVPLSVDGYADALIKMAVDPRRLSGMYIGWCAFF